MKTLISVDVYLKLGGKLKKGDVVWCNRLHDEFVIAKNYDQRRKMFEWTTDRDNNTEIFTTRFNHLKMKISDFSINADITLVPKIR